MSLREDRRSRRRHPSDCQVDPHGAESTEHPPHPLVIGTEEATSPALVRQDIGDAVLAAVDLAVETKWETAKQRAEKLTGDSTSEKIDRLSSLFARELGLTGATAGGVAAVPGLGTATSIAAAVAEFGYARPGRYHVAADRFHGLHAGRSPITHPQV